MLKRIWTRVLYFLNLNPEELVVTRDSRNRLGVPRKFLSSIGLEHNCYAAVQNSGTITRCGFSYDTPLELYSVDSKGNIKISSSVLKQLGFEKEEPVKLVLKRQKISLEKAI